MPNYKAQIAGILLGLGIVLAPQRPENGTYIYQKDGFEMRCEVQNIARPAGVNTQIACDESIGKFRKGVDLVYEKFGRKTISVDGALIYPEVPDSSDRPDPFRSWTEKYHNERLVGFAVRRENKVK
ncbi:MAG TPA: hypothetical protein VJH04_01110 [archaeon]|nr:hypothetical protein [archaeon]